MAHRACFQLLTNGARSCLRQCESQNKLRSVKSCYGAPENRSRSKCGAISLEALKGELDALKGGSFTALSDEELRERIKQTEEGLSIQAPIIPADKIVFRAVKVTQRPSK
jgi:hypothetical protein